MTHPTQQDNPRAALMALRAEIAKVVVGQDAVVSGLVIALLCRGHVLLEGVPGVAKTLLVRTLAAALQLEFKRVQKRYMGVKELIAVVTLWKQQF